MVQEKKSYWLRGGVAGMASVLIIFYILRIIPKPFPTRYWMEFIENTFFGLMPCEEMECLYYFVPYFIFLIALHFAIGALLGLIYGFVKKSIEKRNKK